MNMKPVPALPYSRRQRRLVILMIQAVVFAAAGVCAFLFRFEFAIPSRWVPVLLSAVLIWVIVKSVVFHLARLDFGLLTHASVPDVIAVALGNFAGSAISAAFIIALLPSGFPRTIYFLDLLICLHATEGVLLLARIAGESANVWGAAPKRVVIYGAGAGGMMLQREIRGNTALRYKVCGFIDDDTRKHGIFVQRVTVLGPGRNLSALALKYAISEVLIAIPSASGPDMVRIIQCCRNANLPCKTMPSLADFILGKSGVAQIRDVAVEDLLGRKPVHLEEAAIREKLENRTVMVTGAAGSIGSELCRQIAVFRPRAIVGFDIAETALFHLEQEMHGTFPDLDFYPEIGSIQNAMRLREVLQCHKPSVLYHAAAFKHVPLMETHIFEAVENNVFGTFNVALAATQCGVQHFVLISSDKAVHPTSIMGTTKRIAELLTYSLQNRGTKFVSVRFGNVLGSNGSVVPTFKKQIAAGGPVTITHPEMRRYFMTIPEAAQLVLQASTMGCSGDIFVLDMGEPVKILDLACNLILLSGLRPEQDIRFEFVGPRPGEKLYEEISRLNENTLPTHHEKIKIFMGNGVPPHMVTRLEQLRCACELRDKRQLILEMKAIVPDYKPLHTAPSSITVSQGRQSLN